MLRPFHRARIPTHGRGWAFLAVGGVCPGRGRAFLAIVATLVASAPAASDLEEFKVKREPAFAFTQKPVVTRAGDRVTIEFETKGFCDATAAIEDASGRIVRHLASGVLGPNAPEPFQRNSKKQVIVWDGKDEQGKYLDDKAGLAVRVSLGLKPQFERTLLWSPHRLQTSTPPNAAVGTGPMLAPAKEGVYVYDRNVLLFDHQGNYVRTVYPFRADRLAQVKGLNWHTFPQDGRSLPLKRTIWRNTFLNCDDFNFGGDKPSPGYGFGTMAAQDGRVYLANARLNRVGEDVTTGARPLEGPQTGIAQVRGQTTRTIGPWSSAVSPDGRYLYLAGYLWYAGWYYADYGCLHGVARLDLTRDEPAKPFLGEMFKAGTDNAHFSVPAGVACDAQGRVYVADNMNDRVQVFAPDGTYLKSISTSKPAQLSIHPRTGDIYVFSWAIGTHEFHDALKGKTVRTTFPSTVTRFGPLDRPKVLGSWPLPITCYAARDVPTYCSLGTDYRAVLDGWTDPPTVWLVPGHVHRGHYCEDVPYEKGSIKVLAFEERQLVLKRDFAVDAAKAVVRIKPPKNDRQRLYVNPADGVLYVGEHDRPSIYPTKSFSELVRVDLSGGRPQVRVVSLPFDAEDMAFDLDGNAYLRTENVLARYDSRTWKEIPFDYGEERQSVGFTERFTTVAGGVVLPSAKPGCWHMGGMAVSPTGHIAITCCNPEKPADKRVGDTVLKQHYVRKYTPVLYPGRETGWEIHVYDPYGRVLHRDAIPGIGFTHGIGIDRDDNIYALLTGQRILDGAPYFQKGSCTLFKVKPGQSKALSTGPGVPIALSPEDQPKRPCDIGGHWIEGAAWFYGGAGFRGAHDCSCMNCRPALDLFARSFVPEIEHYSVAVLDTNGNLVTRIGQYGNVDDGMPLAAGARGQGSGVREQESGFLTPDTRNLTPSPTPDTRNLTPDSGTRSIGGDEVALFHACYLGTHSDRRLFIADVGNMRLLSVRLDYHVTERVPLGRVPDRE